MEIIEERRRLKKQVIGKASEWARTLPLKATCILVGSYARDDFNLWSDIDIVVVSEEFEGTPVKRLKKMDITPGFQVIPLTPSEFRKLLAREDSLAMEAVKLGVVLKDDLRLIIRGASS